MAFDFQLRFTGLNVLAVKKGSDPKVPKQTDLFMVQTEDHGDHYHVPRLVCELRSISNPSQLSEVDYELIPDLWGRPLVVVCLAGHSVKIAASNPSGRRLEIPGEEPKDRKQVKKPCFIKWLGKGNIDSLHWLLPIELLNITALDGDILTKGVNDERVAAHVSLPYGTMACDDLILDKSGEHLVFESKSADQVYARSLIADFGTLAIRDVDSCIKIFDEKGLALQLENTDGSPITVSIVNLPPRYPEESPGEELAHLQMLYPLSREPVPPKKRRRICAEHGLTPGSEACPIPTWFYG